MARARASVNFIDASQWRVFLTLFHFLAVYTAPVRAMGRSTRALASGFSGSGRYFAVGDDLKVLHVFSTDTEPWTLLGSR